MVGRQRTASRRRTSMRDLVSTASQSAPPMVPSGATASQHSVLPDRIAGAALRDLPATVQQHEAPIQGFCRAESMSIARAWWRTGLSRSRPPIGASARCPTGRQQPANTVGRMDAARHTRDRSSKASRIPERGLHYTSWGINSTPSTRQNVPFVMEAHPIRCPPSCPTEVGGVSPPPWLLSETRGCASMIERRMEGRGWAHRSVTPWHYEGGKGSARQGHSVSTAANPLSECTLTSHRRAVVDSPGSTLIANPLGLWSGVTFG